MTTNEALDLLLRSYTRYYDIYREDVTEPFAAEAHFHSHDERYFLVKAAKLSESDSHEYVYFALEENLTPDALTRLCDKAWDTGLSHVHATSSHQSSDITLVVLADTITPEAARTIKKARRYKSYKGGLCGFSHFRLIAFEPTSKKLAYNRMGESLKKLFRNI